MNIMKFFKEIRAGQKKLFQNKKLAIAANIVIFFIITALLIAFIIKVTTQRNTNILLFPGGGRNVGWSYYGAAGNTGQEQMNEFGYLDGISGVEKSAVACERVMTEDLTNAYLYFESIDQLISVNLDGKLLYSDIFEAPKDKIAFLVPDASAFEDELKTTYL